MILRYAIYIFAVLMLLAGADAVTAQEEWVQVELEKTVPVDKPEIQIRKELLEEARMKAIERATGVEVTGGEFLSKTSDQVNERENFFESFHTFTNLVVNGKIIDEEKPVYTRVGDVLKINYRGLVAKEEYPSDATFELECSTDRKVYVFDDVMKMNARSTKDAYLTIFSVHNDSISVIFPNKYWTSGNRISAFKPREIPDAEEAKKATMYVMPEKNEYSELLIFVATLDSLIYELPGENPHIYNYSWMDLNRWLLKIPRNRRAQCYWQFQAVPK